MTVDKKGGYSPLVEEMHGISSAVTSEWFPSENMLHEQVFEVKLDERFLLLLVDEVTLIVSMAVEFGKVGFTGEPQAVKYAGSGKVLVCG